MKKDDRKHTKEPIAVVDMDCLYAGSSDTDAFWKVIVEGTPHFRNLPVNVINPEFGLDSSGKDPNRSVTRECAFFDALQLDLLKLGVPPKTAASTDRSQLEVLHLAFRLLERCGYGLKAEFDRNRARVVLGCGMVSPLMERSYAHLHNQRILHTLQHTESFGKMDAELRAQLIHDLRNLMESSAQPLTPDTSTGYPSFRAAGRIANRLNFRGGYSAISTACASSLMSVWEGCRWLRHNECDMVLAGGVDYSMLTTLGLTVFSAAQAVTPGVCLPFDAAADGASCGIGCGLVLLKRHSDAQRDGDSIKALIIGGDISTDGRGVSMTQPSVDGVVRAIQGALDDAGIPFSSIAYIEAHGTGTPMGDETELKALSRVIENRGANPDGVALGAVKQLIGHTHAAAGIAGLIKAILALRHGLIPPMKHIVNPRPPLTHQPGLLYYCSEPGIWSSRANGPRRSLVNALGFGGINCSLIVQESSDESKAAGPARHE